MILSVGQLDILERICADVAKGLFLASLAAPAVTSTIAILTSIRIFILAMILTIIALRLAEVKEV